MQLVIKNTTLLPLSRPCQRSKHFLRTIAVSSSQMLNDLILFLHEKSYTWCEEARMESPKEQWMPESLSGSVVNCLNLTVGGLHSSVYACGCSLSKDVKWLWLIQ